MVTIPTILGNDAEDVNDRAASKLGLRSPGLRLNVAKEHNLVAEFRKEVVR